MASYQTELLTDIISSLSLMIFGIIVLDRVIKFVDKK